MLLPLDVSAKPVSPVPLFSSVCAHPVADEHLDAISLSICHRIDNFRVRGVGLDSDRFVCGKPRTPWIAKYGMLSDYGMSDDVEDEPLAQINQTECLLALYMLHKEGTGVEAVDFLDAEKLEVLQGGS